MEDFDLPAQRVPLKFFYGLHAGLDGQISRAVSIRCGRGRQAFRVRWRGSP
jgi:hypothetical protein